MLAEALVDVRSNPFVSYVVYTILLWITLALHFLFIITVRTNLIGNWCLIVICTWIAAFHLYQTRKQQNYLYLFLTVVTWTWSAGFTAVQCGTELQDYWLYESIPTYTNVDLMNLKGVGSQGRFYFTSSAAVVPRFGGVKYYSDSGDHWTCVLPLLPVNGTSDEPPAPAPFDVRYWVRVENRCCQQSFPKCAQQFGWTNKYQYGVSLRGSLHSQGDALTDACARLPFNKSLPRSITSTQPVFIEWTTPSKFEQSQQWRVTQVYLIVALTAFLWPLWFIGLTIMLIGALCRDPTGCYCHSSPSDCNNCCNCNCCPTRRRTQQYRRVDEDHEMNRLDL